MSKTKLQTASVLAFERKLNNSDALLKSCHWPQTGSTHKDFATQVLTPITLQEKSVRGTISNRQKSAIASDPVKLDAEIQKPNLQTVDVASLPADADTLHVSFSLRVLAGVEPSVCNDALYQAKLREVCEQYRNEIGFAELSKRYAANLANARFLWRNRLVADSVHVQVTQTNDHLPQETWHFDALSLSTRHFKHTDAQLDSLAKCIEIGLTDPLSLPLLKVEAWARVGLGQEVYPSQELLLDAKDSKSKHLYQVSNVAAMHSQKIGNALRTIDDWYPEADQFGPIAVEPYGSVTSRGQAFRQPKAKQDFYNLLDNWVIKDQRPDQEQQHYLMAMLIRGGVFGKGKD